MLCFRSRAPWRMVAVPSAARAHTARSACPPGRQALRDSERGTHQTAPAQLTRDSNPTRSCPSVSCASASRDGCTSSGWVMSSTDREKSSGLGYPRVRSSDGFTRLKVAVEADDAQEVDREVEELLQLGPGLRQMRRARVDALLPFPAIMAENERLTVPHRHATDPERGPRPRRGPSRGCGLAALRSQPTRISWRPVSIGRVQLGQGRDTRNGADPGTQLCPTTCPTAEFPMAKPKSAGIIIRASSPTHCSSLARISVPIGCQNSDEKRVNRRLTPTRPRRRCG